MKTNMPARLSYTRQLVLSPLAKYSCQVPFQAHHYVPLTSCSHHSPPSSSYGPIILLHRHVSCYSPAPHLHLAASTEISSKNLIHTRNINRRHQRMFRVPPAAMTKSYLYGTRNKIFPTPPFFMTVSSQASTETRMQDTKQCACMQNTTVCRAEDCFGSCLRGVCRKMNDCLF